jgi:hypothetical protein
VNINNRRNPVNAALFNAPCTDINATHPTLTKATMKKLLLLAATTLALQGCVVLAVADLAATAVVKTAGLVVDGAVGGVKMVGGAIAGGDKKDEAKK